MVVKPVVKPLVVNVLVKYVVFVPLVVDVVSSSVVVVGSNDVSKFKILFRKFDSIISTFSSSKFESSKVDGLSTVLMRFIITESSNDSSK